jgi:hypothetical protein
MKALFSWTLFFIWSSIIYAQRFDRGGEEPASPPSYGFVILIIIIGFIILWINVGKDSKRSKAAFVGLGVEENRTIIFGRYAIKGDTRLEHPRAFIRRDRLIIVSRAEAERTAEFQQKIEIPIDGIQSIELTKTRDFYAGSKGMGFAGSLTITEKNLQITEFVFNDDSKSEVKRFSEIRMKLINEIKAVGQGKLR